MWENLNRENLNIKCGMKDENGNNGKRMKANPNGA